MGTESENMEEKLISLLGQLQTEQVIFERIVYKNKNQHRRCFYFQFLLKVRRDLKLLQTANLKEILNSCFQVISGKRVSQKVYLLESLKRRKVEVGKYNFLERLLGVVRLLSQMVEPILKAATEISVVLARTFFMGFSLTILALLARIRVLVQQILLDAVSVFNTVSSIAQSKQSVKINQGELEVFREIFPTKKEFVILECVWRSDKFVLLEKTQCSPILRSDVDSEGQSNSKASSSLQYLTIESFLGDETSEGEKESPTNEKGSTHTTNNGLMSEVLVSGQSTGDSASKWNSAPKKVAFVAVKNPVPSSTSNSSVSGLEEIGSKSGKKEDSFFSLLAAGSTKESLF